MEKNKGAVRDLPPIVPAMMPSHHLRGNRGGEHTSSRPLLHPESSQQQWTFTSTSTQLPTVPVAASGISGMLAHLRSGQRWMLTDSGFLSKSASEEKLLHSQSAYAGWPDSPQSRQAARTASQGFGVQTYRDPRRRQPVIPRLARAVEDAMQASLPAPQSARLPASRATRRPAALTQVQDVADHEMMAIKVVTAKTIDDFSLPSPSNKGQTTVPATTVQSKHLHPYLKRGQGAIHHATTAALAAVQAAELRQQLLELQEARVAVSGHRPTLPHLSDIKNPPWSEVKQEGSSVLALFSYMNQRPQELEEVDQQEIAGSIVTSPMCTSKRLTAKPFLPVEEEETSPTPEAKALVEVPLSLSSEEEASANEVVQVQVLVPEPSRRGISARQFEDFFREYCGDVIYEEWEEQVKPICLPTMLAERVVLANRADLTRGCKRTPPRDTNLYAVTDLIIKPCTRREGTSYAELVNPSGLVVDYFISHHWAEDFGEFVQSILRHAVVTGPIIELAEWRDVVYWCCAFANNQHMISLGKTLEESPFYLAMSSERCKGIVMNLNQAASALDRIWCIYEVYLTQVLDKPFTLNFRLGPLAAVVQESKEKDSWVFHIFKMLQHIDVKQAESSCKEDYEKIMGAIESFQGPSGTKGADALNTVVKAMLGSQAIFTLARRGDAAAVRSALELRFNPDIEDSFGIRPITYAAGNGHEEATQILREFGSDPRAAIGAHDVLAMFSANRTERVRAITQVRKMEDEKLTGRVHSNAITNALLQHTSARCLDLAATLETENAELRLEVIRELRALLTALLDHSRQAHDQEELPSLGDAERRSRRRRTSVVIGNFPDAIEASAKGIEAPELEVLAAASKQKRPEPGQEETRAVQRHAQRLAPSMSDVDARVRRAVVEAAVSIGDWFDVQNLTLKKGEIPHDHLAAWVDDGMRRNVVHFAAEQPVPNALHMLATGVDWENDPTALRAVDKDGCSIAHLAVKNGHTTTLVEFVGKKKLPIEFLSKADGAGRTPVHYAAERGDAGSLRLLFDLGCLTAVHVSVPDAAGNRPAHLAAQRGHCRFLEVLTKDCQVTPEVLAAEDPNGRNIVHIAAANGDVRMLKILVQECKIPISALEKMDSWHRTPAHDAALADSPETLEALQMLGAPLHLPAGPDEPQKGAVALVNQSKSVNDIFGNTWRLGRVYYADRNGNLRFEYDKVLKSSDTVTVDRCDFAPTPLVLAEKTGKKKAAEVLRTFWEPLTHELKGKVTEAEIMKQARKGALPAGILVANGAPESLTKLIRNGVISIKDISKKDAMGRTCLHRAARSGVAEAVRTILRLAANEFEDEDLRAPDRTGWTVIHHAAAAGNVDCFRAVVELCSLPMDVFFHLDVWERSVVHVAAEADAAEILQELAKLRIPLHLTMGKPERAEGAVALVMDRKLFAQKNSNLKMKSLFEVKKMKSEKSGDKGDSTRQSLGTAQGGETATSFGFPAAQAGTESAENDSDVESETGSDWHIGRVDGRVFNDDQFTFKYVEGIREGCVEFERCLFAPTALVLAEKLWRRSAVQALLELAWRPLINAAAAASGSEDWQWDAVQDMISDEAVKGGLPGGVMAFLKVGERSPAASAAHAALLRELCAAEVLTRQDLLARDIRGRNALHRAAESGRSEVFLAVADLTKASHENVLSVDLQGRGILHFAALSNDAETVKAAARLMPITSEELAIGDTWHQTPMHLAAMANHIESVKALLEMGVPCNTPSGQTKLEEGTVVLVQQQQHRPGDDGESDGIWLLGLARSVVGSTLTVKYKGGRVELKVQADRCENAPTPLVLAEKFRRPVIAQKLRDALKGNTGRPFSRHHGAPALHHQRTRESNIAMTATMSVQRTATYARQRSSMSRSSTSINPPSSMTSRPTLANIVQKTVLGNTRRSMARFSNVNQRTGDDQ